MSVDILATIPPVHEYVSKSGARCIRVPWLISDEIETITYMEQEYEVVGHEDGSTVLVNKSELDEYVSSNL